MKINKLLSAAKHRIWLHQGFYIYLSTDFTPAAPLPEGYRYTSGKHWVEITHGNEVAYSHLIAYSPYDKFDCLAPWFDYEDNTRAYICNCVTVEKHRKKGLYVYALTRNIKELKDQGYDVLGSSEINNVISHKGIEKSGYRFKCYVDYWKIFNLIDFVKFHKDDPA